MKRNTFSPNENYNLIPSKGPIELLLRETFLWAAPIYLAETMIRFMGQYTNRS